jgi:UDP-N-acetylglucosamine 2-epimerase
MKKICVTIGNRAEEGLTLPIRIRLAKCKDIELSELDVRRLDFIDAFNKAVEYFTFKEKTNDKIDLILIPCDRPEILAVALAAFFRNIPIAHYGAGDVEEDAVHSGDIRHMISLIADVIFVKGEDRKERLVNRGLKAERIFVIDSTAFDDLEVDESLVGVFGKGRYDIVLYHPISKHLEKMDGELREIEALVHQNPEEGIRTIWIAPNGDPGSDIVREFASKIGFTVREFQRPAFLGLLKNCRRIIGNSSCLIYEAPYFLKPEQIVHVGIRNRGRKGPPSLKPGGSDQIVEIIRRFDAKQRKIMPA